MRNINEQLHDVAGYCRSPSALHGGKKMMPLPYFALLISIIIMLSITLFILMRRYHDQ
jgi:hypothetical protein